LQGRLARPGKKKLFRMSDVRLNIRPKGTSANFGARAMMQQGQTAETQIKALIEAWADAVRRHDYSGILAHHDQDIVMFDVPPPLQSRGLDEYRKTWDLFFKYHEPSQAFDIEELTIAAGEDVAFAVAIMRCGSATVSGPPKEGGFSFRLTIGLHKVGDEWRIAHEHHSVPATD
jgi:ketosteroid isomerase-like protein